MKSWRKGLIVVGLVVLAFVIGLAINAGSVSVDLTGVTTPTDTNWYTDLAFGAIAIAAVALVLWFSLKNKQFIFPGIIVLIILLAAFIGTEGIGNLRQATLQEVERLAQEDNTEDEGEIYVNADGVKWVNRTVGGDVSVKIRTLPNICLIANPYSRMTMTQHDGFNEYVSKTEGEIFPAVFTWIPRGHADFEKYCPGA